MFSPRSILALALILCAGVYGGSRVALRITPVQQRLTAQIEGSITEGGGWYPGEPFVTARPVRAWGTWNGSDANTGSLTLGPFPAPSRLYFGLGGYPTQGNIRIYVENSGTRERIRIEHPDVGERWRMVSWQPPPNWKNASLKLVVIDNSQVLGGWVAITEPIQGGRTDGTAALWTSLAAWSVNGLLLGLLWFAAVRILVARTTLAAHWIPLVAAGAVAVAGYLAFWLYFAHTRVGQTFASALLLASAIAVWRTGRGQATSPEIAHPGRLAVLIGVFYLALLLLFPTSLTFHQLAANRFRDTLPADNVLPHLTSARLFAGESLKIADADWLSSDRPPLQSGWQLLTWPATSLLNLEPEAASGTAAIWLQLTWIAAAYGMLRTLGISPRRTTAWIAVLAASGFFLQHTVYTWPKLAAGAFACGAFGLWVLPSPENRRRQDVLGGAVLAALAWLCHGGVAFSFLVLVPWIVWRMLRGEARAWACAALILAVFAGPWLAYQKFYDPPGNRLLKWHLGGQVPKDGRGTWETIRANYAALTWDKILENKRRNLLTPINGDWSGLIDIAPERVKDRRNEEFFYFGRALTWWLGGLALAPFAMARLARRADRHSQGRTHVALSLWTALTIPLWCLLLFTENSALVHQGSFAMVLTAFVLFSAWFELAGRRWLIVVALLQGFSFLFTWAVGNQIVNGSPSPVALAIAAAAAFALSVVVVRGCAETSDSAVRDAPPPEPATIDRPHLERAWPAVAAVVALLPFLWCVRTFADLWWFGDDWDLMERINTIGFWRWTLEPFAENFVPLFKLLWGGLVFASAGSYLPMIGTLWVTHAVNTTLFARLLRRANFSWTAAVPVVGVFALSAANIETLAWSVQWSALLAITFFLLAAEHLLRHTAPGTASRGPKLALLFLLSLASALAFARGVLTGSALAALCLLPFATQIPTGGARGKIAAACFAPALAVAATIYFFSPGNHHALGGHAREIVAFGLSYWAATPLQWLFQANGWDPNTVILLGGIKVALLAWVLRGATPGQRSLLVLLLLLDLGNAVLLGVGRYQTGLPASNSSRYQYNALLCTLPFLGLAGERWLAAWPAPRLRRAIAVAVLLFALFRVASGWPAAVEAFAQTRGRNTRDLLLREQVLPPVGAVPGIPFLATKRAHELIEVYHLH